MPLLPNACGTSLTKFPCLSDTKSHPRTHAELTTQRAAKLRWEPRSGRSSVLGWVGSHSLLVVRAHCALATLLDRPVSQNEWGSPLLRRASDHGKGSRTVFRPVLGHLCTVRPVLSPACLCAGEGQGGLATQWNRPNCLGGPTAPPEPAEPLKGLHPRKVWWWSNLRVWQPWEGWVWVNEAWASHWEDPTKGGRRRRRGKAQATIAPLKPLRATHP